MFAWIGDKNLDASKVTIKTQRAIDDWDDSEDDDDFPIADSFRERQRSTNAASRLTADQMSSLRTSISDAVENDEPIDFGFKFDHPIASWWTEPRVIFSSLLAISGLVGIQLALGGLRPAGFLLAAAIVWFAVVWVLTSRPPHLPTFAYDKQEELPVYTGRRRWCPNLPARRRLAISLAVSAGFSVVLWATLHFG